MPVTTDETIFKAAAAAFLDRPYAEFCHEAVAERVGVDAEELRRRWPDKACLIVDVICDAAGPMIERPGGGQSLRSELITVTAAVTELFWRHGELMLTTLQRMREHPDLDRAFRERYLLPRLECARRVFGTAVLRQQIRPGADMQLVLSLVPAVMTYRSLLRDPAPDPRMAEHLVDALLLPLLLSDKS